MKAQRYEGGRELRAAPKTQIWGFSYKLELLVFPTPGELAGAGFADY